MRVVAVVAVILAMVVVFLVLALVAEMRRRRQDGVSEAARWAEIMGVQSLVHREVEGLLREELAAALDRVQAPEAAVAFSQSGRAMATMTGEPGGPITVDGEGQEMSLGDLERATEELLYEEAEKRGIDPSELSAEMGPSSGGR